MEDSKEIKTEKGNVYSFTRTTRDLNGNPRYLVSWLSLGLKSYGPTAATKEAGLKMYRGKAFGGGFIFESYNLQRSAEFFDKCGLGRPDPSFETRNQKKQTRQELTSAISMVLCRRKHFAIIKGNHVADEMAADIVGMLVENGIVQVN